MFARLGTFALRYRFPIIAFWIVLAAVITIVAPNIEDVASSDQADFLPDDAPFIHANDVYQGAFPDSFAPSSTVIVIDARQAGGLANPDVEAFIVDLSTWLSSDDAPANIRHVFAPTPNFPARALMVSSDEQVGIVRVSLDTTSTDKLTTGTLNAIDGWMNAHHPAGVETYQTGEAPIINNTTEAIETSVDRTIWVTLALVVIMLLLVYRSPISPMIPLAAVTVAYLITRGIVAFLGAHVMTITSYANVMLVVIMYGAGTDYCLFLISRFREEMADQIGVQQATTRTVHLVGETITSSAGTIFVGFMAMSFAEMGIFNSSGPALAIGIVVGLLAGLTFTPALLSTLGDHAFWPGHAKHRAGGQFYEITSKQVSTRPLITILIIVAIMAPFSIYGLNERVAYDMMADLPKDKPAVVGYDVLENSMGTGNVMPLTIVVTGRDPQNIAAEIAHLTERVSSLGGIGDVRSLNSPLGQNNEQLNNLLRVDVQLQIAMQMLTGVSESSTTLNDEQIQTLLSGVKTYFDTLGTAFPQITTEESYTALQEILSKDELTAPDRLLLAASVNALAERFSPEAADPIEDPYLLPTMLDSLLTSLPASDDPRANMMAGLIPNYLTDDQTAYKLDVILDGSPVSYEAMDTMDEMRDLLKQYDGSNGDAVVSGGTAIVTDIRHTMDRDLLRAIGFVLLGIFIVLLIMLRSVVAPLYLIGTVLLSFTCTLGLTSLFFRLVFDVEQITWWVPFFMFVFLVALGVDYSIFLFGRVKEEVGRHGVREGVHIAVARTGAIITSAGMILSGTFAAMMTGEIRGLAEIGFAVFIGVLIDTFVVRTMLDPALAALFGRWTWWPGGIPQSKTVSTSGVVVEPGD
jgi:RND superfamily putative drug exporter